MWGTFLIICSQNYSFQSDQIVTVIVFDDVKHFYVQNYRNSKKYSNYKFIFLSMYIYTEFFLRKHINEIRELTTHRMWKYIGSHLVICKCIRIYLYRIVMLKQEDTEHQRAVRSQNSINIHCTRPGKKSIVYNEIPFDLRVRVFLNGNNRIRSADRLRFIVHVICTTINDGWSIILIGKHNAWKYKTKNNDKQIVIKPETNALDKEFRQFSFYRLYFTYSFFNGISPSRTSYY